MKKILIVFVMLFTCCFVAACGKENKNKTNVRPTTTMEKVSEKELDESLIILLGDEESAAAYKEMYKENGISNAAAVSITTGLVALNEAMASGEQVDPTVYLAVLTSVLNTDASIDKTANFLIDYVGLMSPEIAAYIAENEDAVLAGVKPILKVARGIARADMQSLLINLQTIATTGATTQVANSVKKELGYIIADIKLEKAEVKAVLNLLNKISDDFGTISSVSFDIPEESIDLIADAYIAGQKVMVKALDLVTAKNLNTIVTLAVKADGTEIDYQSIVDLVKELSAFANKCESELNTIASCAFSAISYGEYISAPLSNLLKALSADSALLVKIGLNTFNDVANSSYFTAEFVKALVTDQKMVTPAGVVAQIEMLSSLTKVLGNLSATDQTKLVNLMKNYMKSVLQQQQLENAEYVMNDVINYVERYLGNSVSSTYAYREISIVNGVINLKYGSSESDITATTTIAEITDASAKVNAMCADLKASKFIITYNNGSFTYVFEDVKTSDYIFIMNSENGYTESVEAIGEIKIDEEVAALLGLDYSSIYDELFALIAKVDSKVFASYVEFYTNAYAQAYEDENGYLRINVNGEIRYFNGYISDQASMLILKGLVENCDAEITALIKAIESSSFINNDSFKGMICSILGIDVNDFTSTTLSEFYTNLKTGMAE